MAAADGAPTTAPRRRVGPFSLRQIAAILGTVAVVAAALVVLTRPLGPAQTQTPGDPSATFYRIGNAVEGFRVGDRAPELTVPNQNGGTSPLLDLDGKPISLAALRGHPVWINFFASWCPPCQAEVPTIRDVAAAYRSRGLVVIGIAVQESSPDDVRSYAQRYGLGYTIGFDATGAVYNAWRNNGIPTQYLIDADGIVRQVVLGPLVNPASAEQALTAIVPGPPGSGAAASPSR